MKMQFQKMVAFAMLGVVGLLGAGPTVAVRPENFSKLTVQDRMKLPSEALVVVRGQNVTIATLREAHSRRLLRFAQATSNGRTQAANLRVGIANHVRRPGAVPAPTAATPAAPAPIRIIGEVIVPTPTPTPLWPGVFAALLAPKPVIAPGGHYANVPRDMREFCVAAQASVCLYYPQAAQIHTATDVGDLDAFISKEQCTADTGNWIDEGNGAGICGFLYPVQDVLKFDPGPNPTFDYKFSAGCVSPFVVTADPNGAMVITLTGGGPAHLADVPAGQSCIATAFL